MQVLGQQDIKIKYDTYIDWYLTEGWHKLANNFGQAKVVSIPKNGTKTVNVPTVLAF